MSAEEEIHAHEVIFLGPNGASPVFYYRCLLPAQVLGASWCAVQELPILDDKGKPIKDPETGYDMTYGWPKVRWVSSLIQSPDGSPADSSLPNLADYKIVVIGQPRSPGWLMLIEKLREAGKTVFFEVDDYLHGIQYEPTHSYRDYFTGERLEQYEACMRASSAIICSTEYIQRRYREFNENIFVCRNGLDLARYTFDRPKHDTINIGWAGALGHTEAFLPWFQGIGDIMGRRDDVGFITIGANYADFFRFTYKDRAISIPFAAIEQYPGAMSMFDVGIAPAGSSAWYQGKSDLRYLEAGALGVPLVADADVYRTISHGRTGFKVKDPREAMRYLDMLIEDPELRATLGAAAKEYVTTERSIYAVAQDWVAAFNAMI